jgi:hypothetical protein
MTEERTQLRAILNRRFPFSGGLNLGRLRDTRGQWFHITRRSLDRTHSVIAMAGAIDRQRSGRSPTGGLSPGRSWLVRRRRFLCRLCLVRVTGLSACQRNAAKQRRCENRQTPQFRYVPSNSQIH